eukprot:COSAG01_NODE_2500_length_7559_cov_21.958847_5_plen_110_part_00
MLGTCDGGESVYAQVSVTHNIVIADGVITLHGGLWRIVVIRRGVVSHYKPKVLHRDLARAARLFAEENQHVRGQLEAKSRPSSDCTDSHHVPTTVCTYVRTIDSNTAVQ